MKIELTHEQVDQIVEEELKWVLNYEADPNDHEWSAWKTAAKQLLTFYGVPE